MRYGPKNVAGQSMAIMDPFKWPRAVTKWYRRTAWERMPFMQMVRRLKANCGVAVDENRMRHRTMEEGVGGPSRRVGFNGLIKNDR